MASLSRQLARWVVGLRYEDLPLAVVDRAKGVTLQGLASILLGSRSPEGRQAVKLVVDEETGVSNGATILVNGTRVTKGGAADFMQLFVDYRGRRRARASFRAPSWRRKSRAHRVASSSRAWRPATR